MANLYGRIAAVRTTTTDSWKTIYTCPAGQNTIGTISICCRSSSEIKYSLLVSATGSVSTNKHSLLYYKAIGPYETHEVSGVALSSANTLHAFAHGGGSSKLSFIYRGLRITT